MLRVLVYRNNTKEELELAPGTVISIASLSPFFDTELKFGTQSLPFEFPWSAQNRRVLGAPEMIETLRTGGMPWYTVDVLDDDVMEIAQGKLTILQNRGTFGYDTGTYVGSITGGESRFGALIKGKNLKDLNLGGIVTWSTGTDSRQFAAAVMKQPPVYPFAFAPVRSLDFIDTGRSDYADEWLAGDTINNVVYNAAYPSGWTFGREDDNTPNTAVASGNDTYEDYRTVPFLQLHFIVVKIFEEHGYAVAGEWIDDPDLRDLYLYNNRAIDIYNGSHQDINNFILPANHVPKLSIPEFLLKLQTQFGFGIFLAGDGQMRIRYRKTGVLPSEVVDITNYVENYFEDNLTPIAAEGATIKWDFGSGDATVSDWVKKVKMSQVRVQVGKPADLATVSLSPTPKNGDLAYVRSENYFYLYDEISATWNYHSVYEDDVIIGDGKEEIKLEMAPLLQAVSTDGAGGNTDYDMCAYQGTGSYYNVGKVLVETDYPLRLFFIKRIDKNLATAVPTSFTNNYDALGNKRCALALSLSSLDNLYNQLHKGFYQRMQSGRYYEVKVLKTWLHQLNINFLRGVQIKNMQYMVVEIEKELGENTSYATLKLLPI